MLLRHAAAFAAVCASLGFMTNACGSRSTLLPGEIDPGAGGADASVAQCAVDSDCGDSANLCGPRLCIDGQCIQRFTVCNDDDPCTTDGCDPETGACTSVPATLDVDGDGFNGARPGTVPGAPDSCGDDCDDTSASAYPGAAEVCDSVDNDCNGIVDDGAGYAPPPGGPTDIRVSSTSLTRSKPKGLAHDGTRYFATYGGDVQLKARSFASFLDRTGTPVSTESRIVQVESDTDVNGTVWTGDRFGVVWTDRRSGDYEVFFATFDRDGKKMAPGDVRLSASSVFSINVDLVWTGTEFVAVWQDGEGGNGTFRIVGRRIGLDGVPLGEPTDITTNGQSPRIAVGRPGLGLVFSSSESDGSSGTMFFKPLDFSLRSLGAQREIPSPRPGTYPSVRWNESEFVVSWGVADRPFQLYGTVLDGLGEVLRSSTPLTDSPGNARYGSLIPLGDRLVMVYSDDRDGGRFEIYSQTLDPDLARVGLPTRITSHEGDSVDPIPALGPEGDIGVLFRDDRNAEQATYFTRLTCETGPPQR